MELPFSSGRKDDLQHGMTPEMTPEDWVGYFMAENGLKPSTPLHAAFSKKAVKVGSIGQHVGAFADTPNLRLEVQWRQDARQWRISMYHGTDQALHFSQIDIPCGHDEDMRYWLQSVKTGPAPQMLRQACRLLDCMDAGVKRIHPLRCGFSRDRQWVYADFPAIGYGPLPAGKAAPKVMKFSKESAGQIYRLATPRIALPEFKTQPCLLMCLPQTDASQMQYDNYIQGAAQAQHAVFERVIEQFRKGELCVPPLRIEITRRSLASKYWRGGESGILAPGIVLDPVDGGPLVLRLDRKSRGQLHEARKGIRHWLELAEYVDDACFRKHSTPGGGDRRSFLLLIKPHLDDIFSNQAGDTEALQCIFNMAPKSDPVFQMALLGDMLLWLSSRAEDHCFDWCVQQVHDLAKTMSQKQAQHAYPDFLMTCETGIIHIERSPFHDSLDRSQLHAKYLRLIDVAAFIMGEVYGKGCLPEEEKPGVALAKRMELFSERLNDAKLPVPEMLECLIRHVDIKLVQEAHAEIVSQNLFFSQPVMRVLESVIQRDHARMVLSDFAATLGEESHDPASQIAETGRAAGTAGTARGVPPGNASGKTQTRRAAQHCRI